MRRILLRRVSLGIGLLGVAASPASADDLGPIRVDFERACPSRSWTTPSPLHRWCLGARRLAAPWSTASGSNGVVLIASTKTVGTGVVTSGHGDIITSENIYPRCVQGSR